MNESRIKEVQTRQKLKTIKCMIAKTSDPESRARLELRRAELERELKRCDTKRQEHARALWHELIEKRQTVLQTCTLRENR